MFVLGKAYQPSVNLGEAPGVTHKHKAKLERLARDKHSILFGPYVNYYKRKSFITLAPEAYTLKLFTALT